MSILSLFHKVGAAYKNDRSKNLAAHVLLVGGIAKGKQSWDRRVRTVACSCLVINSHKEPGQNFKNNSIANS